MQADQHDAGDALLGELDRGIHRAHEIHELLVAHLHEVVFGADLADLFLAGRLDLDDDADRFFLHPLAEVLHHIETDIGLEQGSADVF